VAGTREATTVYADDLVVAFRDIRPIAPVHVLVVPRRHVESLAATDDEPLLGRLLAVGARIARAEGLSGFKTVVNTGREAGQTVFHLHVHVIGGRRLGEH
jgi:histidine triad (HIT) family protein